MTADMETAAQKVAALGLRPIPFEDDDAFCEALVAVGVRPSSIFNTGQWDQFKERVIEIPRLDAAALIKR